MNQTNDLKYWIAFSYIQPIGALAMKLLRAYFPDMRSAWQADQYELLRAGLPPHSAAHILHGKKAINPDATYATVQQHRLAAITINNPAYPAPLRELHDPPATLYVRGQLPTDWRYALAVVGTRKTSLYGRRITSQLVEPLAQAGLIIISGLALGIDALSHQSALSVNGTTVGVLASGLDTIYPRSNNALGESIIARGGALVSEYPPGIPPSKRRFPVRNRIIAGLSRAVLVIEGATDSGSLITARCGLDQNRDVFAVPGNICNATAAGPNYLIQMGAYPVTSPDQILEQLDAISLKQYKENKKIIPDTPEEQTLITYFTGEPVHIDEIMQTCKLKASIINATLVTMEMKGLVRHCGAGRYILNK